MADIFISYVREDLQQARQLAEALEAFNWSVWWDRDIPTGRTFDEVIEEEIGNAGCIIVLWSARSVGSRWVRTEAAEGAQRDILVPIKIEDCTIPLAFRRIQTADLAAWDWAGDSPPFEELINDLARILGPPPVQPTEKAPEKEGRVASPRRVSPLAWLHFLLGDASRRKTLGLSGLTVALIVSLWFGLGTALNGEDAHLLYSEASSLLREAENAEDVAAAFDAFVRAARAGHAEAMALVGSRYEDGFGVERDSLEAVRWYLQSAAAGSSVGMVRLGDSYRNGSGVQQDDGEAARWYLAAAKKGDRFGMSRLGWFYEDGRGLQQDLTEAVRWYEMAAEAGETSAMISLGNMYKDGRGVQQDDGEAARWYRLAARLGATSANAKLRSLGEDSSVESLPWAQPDSILVHPVTLLGGDGDFAGNGPRIDLTAIIMIDSDRCGLDGRVVGKMTETTRSNPTVADVRTPPRRVYTAPAGKRIESIVARTGFPFPKRIEAVDRLEERLAFLADGHSIHSHSGGYVVESWQINADIGGIDVPDFSAVKVRFRPQELVIRNSSETDGECG